MKNTHSNTTRTQEGPRRVSRGPAIGLGLLLAAAAIATHWRLSECDHAAPGGTKAPQTVVAAKITGDAAPVIRKTLRSDMIKREGLYYFKSETNAFTGVMEEYYEPQIVKSRCSVVAGLFDGVCEGWYTNGQIQVREHFRQGMHEGVQTKWYFSGVKESETHCAGGKCEGLFQRWYENGALQHRVELSQGVPDGLSQAYYPDGSLKAEVQSGKGNVISRRTWKAGEFKQTVATIGVVQP